MTKEIDGAAFTDDLMKSARKVAEHIQKEWNEYHVPTAKEVRLVAAAILYARAQDDGWVWVPKAPTPDMYEAAEEACERSCSDPDADALVIEVYKAFLAAAPLRQQEGG